LSPARSWFEERPLFGQTVLVTRPREQIAPLKQRLENLGARVLVQPAIEISPPVEWQSVDETLDRLDKYDWIVFSSANGVQSLFDRLLIRHGDIRRLGEAKLAAIGPATADALASYRVRADVIPPQFRAESLADALRGEAAGCRFLLARASRGREILAESLEAAGGRVEQVVVYQSTDVTEPNTAVIEALDNGQVDWITMTSSAIARSTAALLGDRLRGVKLASISPITSETLRSVRLEPTVEATEYTMDGIVTAILQASLSDR